MPCFSPHFLVAEVKKKNVFSLLVWNASYMDKDNKSNQCANTTMAKNTVTAKIQKWLPLNWAICCLYWLQYNYFIYFNIVCIDHSHGKTDIRVFEEKERMLMMCTCSRQRSLSMKYFNKKHKISKTKKAGDAKKFTLYQRPIPYNVNFLSFKIQNICHGQYLYSNQNLKSQDPSTM